MIGARRGRQRVRSLHSPGRPPADAAGSASDIYTINAIGRADLTRLTNHDADDTDPAWSPDGSKIAFASNRNGHYDIYVMQANGLLETRITSTDADDRHPTWSPDGSMIAFDRTVAGGTRTRVPLLYAMTASGANETFLMIGEEPSWSPTPTVAAPTGVASTLTAGGVTVTFAGVSSSDTSRDTTILPTAPAAPSDFAPGYVAIDGAGVVSRFSDGGGLYTACHSLFRHDRHRRRGRLR